jgi:hypothetical protein
MSKKPESLFNVRIRSIEPRDFGFIQSLATSLPAFTVPSDFVLWLFTKFHPEYCRVLEDESGTAQAYLIAMPTSDPPTGIVIWQIAAAGSGQPFALEYFAAYLRDLVERTSATSVFFTASSDPASLRLIRSLTKHFGNCDFEQIDLVPASPGEHVFRITPIFPNHSSHIPKMD